MRKLSWLRILKASLTVVDRSDPAVYPDLQSALASIWEDAYSLDYDQAMTNPLARQVLRAFWARDKRLDPSVADPNYILGTIEGLNPEKLMAIKATLESSPYHFILPSNTEMRAVPAEPGPAAAPMPAEKWKRPAVAPAAPAPAPSPTDPLQQALQKLRRRNACNWLRTVTAISGVDTNNLDPVDMANPAAGSLSCLPRRRRRRRQTPRLPGATPSADVDR